MGLKELLAYEGNVEEDMALTFQVFNCYSSPPIDGLFFKICDDVV